MALSAPQAGDVLSPADINGHLLLVIPTEYVPSILTQYTEKGKDGDPAIRVNVAVLTQPDASGQPSVYRGALWFNWKLHSNLKRQIGQTILARMGQGQATSGNSAPWLLVNALNDPQAVAFAEQWLATPEGIDFEGEAAQAVNAAAALNNTPGMTQHLENREQGTAPNPVPLPVGGVAPSPAVPQAAAPPAYAPAPAVAPVATPQAAPVQQPVAAFPSAPVGFTPATPAVPSGITPPAQDAANPLLAMLASLSPAEQQAMLAQLGQNPQQ